MSSESEPSDLIFRTDDFLRWGPGKGANLEAVEIDLNFWILLQRLLALETTPLQPKEIYSIDVVANQMTIMLNDGVTVFGPFTLPVADFNWTDAWQPGHGYSRLDFFTAAEGVYLVLQDHVSLSVFDPEASDVGGPFYKLIFPFPSKYDVGFFFPGLPGTGIATDSPLFVHRAAHSFYIRAGSSADSEPPEHVGGLEIATTIELVFSIQKNGVEVGTMTIAADATEATFSFPDDVQFVANDRLAVVLNGALDLDNTARDLSVTFAAVKGTLA